jgi:hypothetical protein
VGIGSQSGVTHLPQHLPQRRVAAQVGTEQHGIHKEAKHALNFLPWTIGEEGGHAQVGLPGVAVQKDFECGQEGHEEGATFSTAQAGESLDQLPRKSEGLACCVEA